MNTVEQRKIIAKFAVVIVAVLLILLCYSYFLPRTEVEIDTVYHSSYSGLFVQSKISNTGTKEITDLKVKLAVWNSTDLLQSETHYPGVLWATRIKFFDICRVTHFINSLTRGTTLFMKASMLRITLGLS